MPDMHIPARIHQIYQWGYSNSEQLHLLPGWIRNGNSPGSVWLIMRGQANLLSTPQQTHTHLHIHFHPACARV